MGRIDEAAAHAHKALDAVNKARTVTDLPDAEAVLAETLLTQGKVAELANRLRKRARLSEAGTVREHIGRRDCDCTSPCGFQKSVR